MKKIDFIKKVLKHDKNTVFVSEAIVERTLEIFEDLGMAPPFYDKIQDNNGEKVLIPAREWEDE